MSIFDGLFGKKDLGTLPPSQEFEVNRAKVKLVEVGSTGTEIFGGYLTEEYLDDLKGRQAADIYDKMRRSDPKIKMITSAMKNPIKSGSWQVMIKPGIDESDENAIAQKELIEHILFHDLGDDGKGGTKTWTRFLHEALSMIEFGFSAFEKTYKPVLGHPKFGSYNGIKSLGFRSQRTIEKWNLCKAGTLASVSQFAYGDSQKVSDIPASFLLHFAIEMEGSNYEGISILRSCYGPWLRKNNFLKLIATGTEKYAMGIPTLEIPSGQENTEQYQKALDALRKYVSGKAAYLTRPKGWELTITANPFDAQKIRAVVNEENVEIVNSALANFLELGQSGSGSYSLSFDLSDFFLGGLEHVAGIICEEVNQGLIKDLVMMNFGTSPMVELKCSGISDKAGEELSKVIFNLTQVGHLTPDDKLEDSLRKRFGLPNRDESSSRAMPTKGGFETTDSTTPLPNTESNVVTPTQTPSVVPTTTANPVQSNNDTPAALSMNGAQVSSMIEVVTKFKEGVLDQESAIEVLMAAFPIDREQATRIVGEPLKKAPIDVTPAAVPAGKPLALSEETPDESGKPTKDPVVKLIDDKANNIRGVIKDGLKSIASPLIKELVSRFEKGGTEKFNTSLESPDVTSYQSELEAALKDSYHDAQSQVAKEIPGAKAVTLAEDPKAIALARINADVMNLSSAQVNDLIKSLTLTYGQNLEAAQSTGEIISILDEAVQKFIEGPVSNVGADIQAAKTVNDSRRDFFKDNTESIVSYTWVNGDPVSDICKFLDGKTIPADSPDVERYWPPLHHNCKTYVVANTADTTDNPDPLSSFDVPDDIASSMTLSDLRGKKLTRITKRRRIRS